MVTVTKSNVSEVVPAQKSLPQPPVPLTDRLLCVAEWLLFEKGEPVDAIYVYRDGRHVQCRLLGRYAGRDDTRVVLMRIADGRESGPIEFTQVQLPAVLAARLERLAGEAEAYLTARSRRSGHNLATGQFVREARR